MPAIKPTITPAILLGHVFTLGRVFTLAWILTMAWMPISTPLHAEDLICCGGEEVFTIAVSTPGLKKWSWRAEQSSSIPASFHAKFRSTDECKPYNERLLLITSSSGGVALIDRETKQCEFLAESRNAHSACLLPDRQIAVASSFGGDQVQFFDRGEKRKPAELSLAVPVQVIPLLGAHGVVWDAKRDCLWALGEKELLALVAETNGSAGEHWQIRSRTALPSNGGHDLSPRHDGRHLFVTTDTEVLVFDRKGLSFEVADGFDDSSKVKSVDQNRVSGRIVFHRASDPHWWSDTIRFLDAEALKLNGERLYKVRWDTPAPIP